MLKVHQNIDDSIFDSSAYHINKKYLIIVGAWPYLTPGKRKLMWLAINLALFTVWIPQLIHIIVIIDRKKEVIYCLMTYLCASMGFNSSVNGLLNNGASDDERTIFATYANYGKMFTVGLSISYYLVILSYIVSALMPSMLHYYFTGNWTIPERNIFEAELFVDPVEYYWPLFIHGIIIAFVAIWILLAYDCFFIMIVLYCCGMFSVLLHKIEQMDTELYNYSYDQQLALEKIEEIVTYHLKCLEFAQKVEDFFCIQYVIQLLINTIVISVCGSQVINIADESPLDIFRYTYVAGSVIFRLSLTNVCGQSVHDRSLRVYEQLIHRNWYEYPIQIRKLFIVLYNRSVEPCNLTAGKMVNLNLETFSKLMKTALSYCMMIIQTQ
ncbi:odorant receptor 9a-like isoform X2 [Trichogramma pretiosum]|uniref:odorant receptor 9a-like isoform X2 n=1 Tax=Trichogramma pretiosum TaxID=7493 RepID=UPI0006C9D344|nr:odorant receptor 9a-like isoform X2 [Trichogramma pretiosum]